MPAILPGSVCDVLGLPGLAVDQLQGLVPHRTWWPTELQVFVGKSKGWHWLTFGSHGKRMRFGVVLKLSNKTSSGLTARRDLGPWWQQDNRHLVLKPQVSGRDRSLSNITCASSPQMVAVRQYPFGARHTLAELRRTCWSIWYMAWLAGKSQCSHFLISFLQRYLCGRQLQGVQGHRESKKGNREVGDPRERWFVHLQPLNTAQQLWKPLWQRWLWCSVSATPSLLTWTLTLGM